MEIEPITREEMLLSAIADGSGSDMKPITREEMFLHAIANGSETELEPITRKEMFLDKILKNGIGGGGSGSGSCDDVRYVTFMSYDGLIEYGKRAVAVGDDCADPIARGIFNTPARESDPQYSYTFYGWATTPGGAADSNWNKAITEDKTVYANFASAVQYYTITYYDDDGVTVLKTETLPYGSMPSYIPQKDGFNFEGWNPNFAAVTADASYTATWSEIVNIYTWENVLKSVAGGNYKNVYAVGDLVPLDLGSEGVINMQIAAFDADTLADGSGNAAITWIAKELLATKQRINPALVTNDDGTYQEGTGAYGGWEKCEMRNVYLKETIKPLIPENVRNAIKTVKKKHSTNNASNKSVKQTTFDDLWILEYSEVFTNESKYNELINNTNANRIKRFPDGTVYNWWLRDNQPYQQTMFRTVTGSGTMNSGNSDSTNGIALCFCT